jgi:hypothetical protein
VATADWDGDGINATDNIIKQIRKCDLNPRSLFGFLSSTLYHLLVVVLWYGSMKEALVELMKNR